MKKKRFKKFWIVSTLLILSTTFFSYKAFAAGDDLDVDWFNIIPELTEEEIKEWNEIITEIWQTWWKVMDNYRKKANELPTKKQVAYWIMNRNTIMNYIVFVIQFLSQLWLVVWWWFIMYAWYKYMISVFEWWKGTPSSTVKNAIIWIIIVIFSYAIMRTLTSIIWLT